MTYFSLLQVIPANDNENSIIPHSFKIMFKECDCEAFIPLVFELIGKVRQRYRRSRAKHRVDRLHEATKTPVDEMTRYAYVMFLAFFTMKLLPLSQFIPIYVSLSPF